MNATLPSEIAAAVALAHRSPTYAVALKDGRTLRLRREADIHRPNGTLDPKLAREGGGKTRWVAHCDGCQSEGDNLGKVLLGALGIFDKPNQPFDAWWAEIETLVGTALALVEAAVPNEKQQAVFS